MAGVIEEVFLVLDDSLLFQYFFSCSLCFTLFYNPFKTFFVHTWCIYGEQLNSVLWRRVHAAQKYHFLSSCYNNYVHSVVCWFSWLCDKLPYIQTIA